MAFLGTKPKFALECCNFSSRAVSIRRCSLKYHARSTGEWCLQELDLAIVVQRNLIQHNLKDDAGKVLHSICQQIWKTQQWPQDWKMSVFIPIPKKDNAKECSNYRTIALISHASKVMLKILQASLQQYFQMFKPVLEKAEKPEIKWPTSFGSSKKQECSRKTSISALLTMPKPLTMRITIHCGKFWKRWD